MRTWLRERFRGLAEAFVVLVMFFAGLAAWFQGKTLGQAEGVDFYHSMCYNSSTPAFVAIDTRVVVCSRLTTLDKPLDSLEKTVYTK